MLTKPRSAYQEILQEEHPDVAIVVRDSMAVSFINVARQLHISIPDDLQVIGFQNTKYAELSRPKLSCIETPIYDLGEKAMDLLTKLMDIYEADDDEEIEELEWPEHTFMIETEDSDNIFPSEEEIEEQNASTQDITEKEQIEQYEKTDNYVTNPVPYTISTNETSEINKNIYSEITGISKEISLATKLENDLVHATSSEQDLSLFIVKIPGLLYSSEKTKEIVNTLLQQFLYRDTIFEFENDGFAIIKSDINAQQATAFYTTDGVLITNKKYMNISDVEPKLLKILTNSKNLIEELKKIHIERSEELIE